MAALAAIVTALFRSAWRSLRGPGSLMGNNLFPVIALLMAEEPLDRPSSTAVFYLVIGLLTAVPLANDMARRIPRDRIEPWPLRRVDRVLLSAVSLLLNPALFLALVFALLSRHAAVGAFLFITGAAAPLLVNAGRAMLPRRTWPSPLRLVPRFPGTLGGLVQNNLRELLQTLDVWFAVFFSLIGVAYRMLDPNADPASTLVLGALLVIILSTLAQPGLGFDAEALRTRAGLLPVSGVSLLFARDLAWFVVAVVVTAPFRLAPAVAAAFAALAVGHRAIGIRTCDQHRWHFASGQIVSTGLYQILFIILATVGVEQFGLIALAAAAAGWGGSLYWYGRRFDHLT